MEKDFENFIVVLHHHKSLINYCLNDLDGRVPADVKAHVQAIIEIVNSSFDSIERHSESFNPLKINKL